jgi:formiminotetrahydrofolate cyclodeaminase
MIAKTLPEASFQCSVVFLLFCCKAPSLKNHRNLWKFFLTRQVLSYRLSPMTSSDPKEDVLLLQFLDAVAAGTPTPGGGSVSALAGSMGAALVEMVLNLTLKKEKSGSQEELKGICQEAHELRSAFTETLVKDIVAYQGVMEAYLLPQATDEEKKIRKEEIQKALKRAIDPPLFTAATSLKLLRLCRLALEKGNPNTITDTAVAALMANAALRGGVFNAQINLAALQDRQIAGRMKKELERLDAEGQKIATQIMEQVNQQLR